jgi:hypothetical protein
MPDNRDAIVDAVVARMQGITTANVYQTDAGQNVFRWRTADVAPSECPAIDVRDPERRLLGVYTQNVRDYELAVECTAFAAAGAGTDTALNQIVEDMLKAVLDGDETWGGLAVKTAFEGDRKGLEQRDVKVGIAVVRFLIHYRQQ